MKKLLIALSIICISSITMADMGFGSCRIYFASEADLSEELREILPLAQGGPVRACVARSGQPVYDVLSPVGKGALSACRYTSQRVFQHMERGKPTWTLTPPPEKDYLGRVGLVMAASQGKCPVHGDPAYFSVENISEGVFLEILRFWDGITSSGRTFDTAFEDFPPWARSSDVYRSFEAAVKSSAQRPKLETISLANQQTHQGAVPYDLLLRGTNGRWILSVDFVGGQLKALDLGIVH